MSGFRVVETAPCWRGAFLEVVDAHIVASDGSTFQRDVVRHPGAVVIVPVTEDRTHAILVRQFRAAVDDDLLEVPAGKRDVDGEPPEETARRELAEEIGYRPGRLVKLCEFFNSPGFSDEYTHLFCALDLEPLAEAHAVTAEEAAMTVEHIPFTDVDALIERREIVDAKTIIGLMQARRYLESTAGRRG
ncbi:MAG: NUDIX hydrolase [Acidimicrobiia bacterium]|nr:NUDIX hydrolase [Acidimicrobiia bacterium]